MQKRRDLNLFTEWEEAVYWQKRFSRLGWALLVYLLAGAVVQLVVVALIKQFVPWWMEQPVVQWLLMAVSSYGVSFPLFIWMLRKVPGTAVPLKSPLAPFQLVEAYLISLAVVYGSNLVTALLHAWIAQLTGLPVRNPVDQLLNYPTVLNLILTCVLAPLVEEIMFRRMILNRLRRFGDRFAILASAALFALLHGNLSQILYAFAIGVVLGYVVLRTGCLWQSILIHAMVNFISSGLIPLLERLGEPGDRLLTCFILGSMTVGGICLFRQRSTIHLEEGTVYLCERAKWGMLMRNPGMLCFCALILILCISDFI